jgi:hypothetical protein
MPVPGRAKEEAVEPLESVKPQTISPVSLNAMRSGSTSPTENDVASQEKQTRRRQASEVARHRHAQRGTPQARSIGTSIPIE